MYALKKCASVALNNSCIFAFYKTPDYHVFFCCCCFFISVGMLGYCDLGLVREIEPLKEESSIQSAQKFYYLQIPTRPSRHLSIVIESIVRLSLQLSMRRNIVQSERGGLTAPSSNSDEFDRNIVNLHRSRVQAPDYRFGGRLNDEAGSIEYIEEEKTKDFKESSYLNAIHNIFSLGNQGRRRIE